MSPLRHPVATASYVAFLFGEVVAGSVRVARLAFSPRSRLTPAIVEFPLRCDTDAEVTTLASSITITPGTLVVGVSPATDDAPVTLFVHSVFDDDRASILAGLRDMEARMLRMSRGTDEVTRGHRLREHGPGADHQASGGADRRAASGGAHVADPGEGAS